MPFNPIVFIIPPDSTVAGIRDTIIADEPGSATLFNTDGNFQLFLNPSEYIATVEGEATRVIGGFASTSVIPTKRRLGFEVRSSEGRHAAFRMLRSLDRYSKTNSVNLTVLDYCHLDLEADHAAGYRTRSGILIGESIRADGATVRRWSDVTSERYSKGLSFKFVETGLEL